MLEIYKGRENYYCGFLKGFSQITRTEYSFIITNFKGLRKIRNSKIIHLS